MPRTGASQKRTFASQRKDGAAARAAAAPGLAPQSVENARLTIGADCGVAGIQIASHPTMPLSRCRRVILPIASAAVIAISSLCATPVACCAQNGGSGGDGATSGSERVFEAGSALDEIYGSAPILGAGTLGLFAAGRLSSSPRLTGAATDLSKALLVNGALVWALNAGIRYGRGDADGPAFPSSSTSAAFAIAPILRGRFGWKAGVPALALASFAAAGEMDEGARTTPEIFGGAAIGLVVGGFMAYRESGDNLPAHICVDKNGVGVEFKF